MRRMAHNSGMMTVFKSVLFSVFQKTCRLLWGKGLGKVPGVSAIHGYLFRLLLAERSILEVQGSKICMNPYGLPKSYVRTFQSYLISHNWEEQTGKIFKEVVKESNVVVDLGANIGFFTLLASKLVGKTGRVYAFEPEPTNYTLLLKNIELNRCANVIAVQKAVSNEQGVFRLNVNSDDTGAHTLRSSVRKDEFKESIEVECVTLDNYFCNREDRIDIIKIDVEGAEVRVFRGMQRVLKANENIKLFVEFYPDAIREMGDCPEEFARELFEGGFSVIAIDDYSRRRSSRRVSNVDDLMKFVSRKLTVNLFLWKNGASGF